jgi:polyadenylate-binding protein
MISQCTQLICRRIEDEAALKAKVDEALAVYDEYVKTQGQGEAKKEEETKA